MRLDDFGIVETPCWSAQRKMIWAGLFPYFSANAINGLYSRDEYSQMQFNMDVIGQVEKQFSQNLHVNVLMGFNYNSLNTGSVGASSQNFILPDGPKDFDNAKMSASVIGLTSNSVSLSFSGL